MTNIDLLKRIKKLKVKELKEVALKLSAIQDKKDKIFYGERAESKQPWTISYPVIDIHDIEKALDRCIFHFTGNCLETPERYECGCGCLCTNCEVIPTHPIAIMMRKMSDEVTEDIEIMPWRD